MSSRDYLTIGEVVQRLRGSHPDLSISKLRFLEDEGLITPERTQGGYRKFSHADVTRVETILKLQKDHFFPLAIIKEKLAELDRGRIPAELERATAASGVVLSAPPTDDDPIPLEDVQATCGVPASFAKELDEFGIIRLVEGETGPILERVDLSALHAAWDLRKFGVEPRHLRMYEMFAEREATLFAQIVLPSYRHRTPDSKKRLSETLTELGSLTDQLKGRLLRRALAKAFEDVA